MYVRALKTTFGGYGMLPKGGKADIPDAEAKELIALGYVSEVVPIEKRQAAPQSKVAEDAVKDAPFEKPLAGGRDGAEKRSPASQEGRQRRKRRSTGRGD